MNYIQMLILNIKKNINFKHVSINEFYYYFTVLILGTLNIHAFPYSSIFRYLWKIILREWDLNKNLNEPYFWKPDF